MMNRASRGTGTLARALFALETGKVTDSEGEAMAAGVGIWAGLAQKRTGKSARAAESRPKLSHRRKR